MRHERIERGTAEAALARALIAAARAAGLAASVGEHRSRPWASATFTGARHTLTVRLHRAPALGEWIAALPEAAITARGHLVADLSVERHDDDAAGATLTLAVLTIEDR